MIWWCPKCGLVWTAAEAPICRHAIGSGPGPAAARMVALPSWHPLHPGAVR